MTRPDSAATSWWLTLTCLSNLVCQTVQILHDDIEADISLAHSWFNDTLAPTLLESTASELLMDRYDALRSLQVSSQILLPEIVMTRLVKKRSALQTLIEACCSAQLRTDANDRAGKREQSMHPQAIAAALQLLATLLAKSTTEAPSSSGTPLVVPGPYTLKMMQRGVVPLLIAHSKSPIPVISAVAVAGLSKIAFIKDVRVLLLREPGATGLVLELLRIPFAKTAMHTMELVGDYLLADPEWHKALLTAEPPLQETAVKLAMQSLKSFGGTHGTKVPTKYIDGCLTPDQDESEIAMMLLKASFNFLSSMIEHHRDSPSRLVDVGALHLAAVCVDFKHDNVRASACSFFKRFLMIHCIKPEMFSNPEILINSVLPDVGFHQLNDLKQDRTLEMRLQIASTLYSSGAWRPVFSTLGIKQGRGTDNLLNGKRLKDCLAALVLPPQDPEGITVPFHKTYHESCSKLTGKLKKCGGCGKLEGEKETLMVCSKCLVARYCSHECQNLDWKKHRKECARPALSSSEKTA